MTMQVALMVPCYIDMFYPHVGIATLELPERLGVDFVYPKEQTCCGQPMANSGCYEEARATEEHCARVFGSFDLRGHSVRQLPSYPEQIHRWGGLIRKAKSGPKY